MTLTVLRDQVVGLGVPGTLELDSGWQCYTLERASTLIPIGTYPVALTPSYRASVGTLWSPDPLYRLPLIQVPGRSGIRIHAANQPTELEGCIAVGQVHNQDELMQSRAALTILWNQLIAEPNSTFTIDIRDAPPPE